jgi:hypothetical protein
MPARRQPVAKYRGSLFMQLVAALLVILLALAAWRAVDAQAGTYVINNCPSAGNGNAGSWTVFGSPQNTKGTCSGGPGDYIGPRGGSMSPGALAGAQIGVPGGTGITIREAKIWWQVSHQISGADTFAIAADNGGAVGESTTPLSAGNPDTFVLASTTTELTLASYCSNDDYGNGCTFGGGENNILELYGSRLTLEDNSVPNGTVTGGALAGTGTYAGTQSLTFTAGDGASGVRTARLMVDGKTVSTNDYLAQCPYQNFLACPATISDSISWNTATAGAGTHEIALVIESAAGDTTIVDEHTISTDNPPAKVEAPYVTDTTHNSGEPQVGDVLRITPGQWSPQPSSFVYQWQLCESSGASCNNIPGASGQLYTVTSVDSGHMIVGLVTAVAPAGSAQTQAGSEVISSQSGSGSGSGGGSGGANGSNGANGANGSNGGSGGSGLVTVNVNGSGSNQGVVLLGSGARWSVSLSVSPRRVRRRSRIRLSGVVSTSPRPGEGKLVFLQARSVGSVWRGRGRSRRRVTVFGKWVTFQEFRAKSSGAFASTYTFKLGGRHTYQFQAVAPAEGQFRNPTGTSSTITVKEV